MTAPGASPAGSDTRGFAAAAASGSAWTTVQTVINKTVTVVAMLALARLLTPEDFGRANIATSVGAFISVISPFVLGDVLLSMPQRFRAVSGAAFWIGVGSAIVLFLALLGAAPVVESTSGKVGVAACVALVAFRPICDAILIIPFAKLRIDLAFRTLAMIDLAVILLATVASLAMAWMGMGAAALIVPPIATLAVRGLAYWTRVGASIPLRPEHGEARPLARRFAAASLGQYMNNVLQILEMLVLGWFASASGAGFFGFAFQLAIQANTVVAVQFGAVLQPIFGLLKSEPVRQVSAFMRASRLLAAVAIPVSTFQAVLAVPAFKLLFGSKWDGAVAIFVALSVGQAFMFVAAPASAIIKAQGRFRAYVAWQFGHLAVAAAAFVAAAMFGGDLARSVASALRLPAPEESAPALAVAIASSLVWAVSCPVGVWICGRPAGLGVGAVLALFRGPWLASLPTSAALLGAWAALASVLPGKIASGITVLGIAPPMLVLAVWLAARGNAETRADLASIVGRFTRRRAAAG